MKLLAFGIFFTILVQILCDDWTASCNATRCTCKWMNGKKTALCDKGGYSQVPVLSSELQTLSLNDNNLNYLDGEEFYRNGLEHLQRIYLRNSFVAAVHQDAFKNLRILVEIDLSGNRIEGIDRNTFTGNDRLRILLLHGNPIKRLLSDQFPPLPHLRTLDLHGCRIEEVDRTSFRNLNRVEYLNMKNNSISFLHGDAFANVDTLKTLILDDNPWHCDCKLRKFRNWYLKENPNHKLVCKYPLKYGNKTWDLLDETLFGCLPTVELISDRSAPLLQQQTEEEMGPSNVSFHCLITGDPKPEVNWEFNSNRMTDGNVFIAQTCSNSSDVLPQDDNVRVGWSNMTILNVTSLDSGIYSCSASNSIGTVSRNVTLFIPKLVNRVSIRTHETFWYFGVIIGTFGTIFSVGLILVAVCYCRNVILRTQKRDVISEKMSNAEMKSFSGASLSNGKILNGTVCFNDQEKKLLELSVSTYLNSENTNILNSSASSTVNNSMWWGLDNPI